MMHAQKLSLFHIPLVSLLCGIALQSIFQLHIGFLILFLFGSLAYLLFTYKKTTPTVAYYFFIPFFFALGSFLFQFKKNSLATILEKYKNQTLNLVGTISHKEKIHSDIFNEVITLDVTKVQHKITFEVFEENFIIQLYLRKKSSLLPADTIYIKNILLDQTKNKSISGNPTFNDYLIKNNVLASVFVTKKNIIKRIRRPKFSLKRWLWQKRISLYYGIKKKLSPCSFSYLSLMFLGFKHQPERDKLRNNFNIWGIAHFLARSGLHIVLFVLMWKFLFCFIPLHLFFKRILLILLCLLYGIFSWPSLSFLRAYSLFLLLQVGSLLYRQTNFLYLLSLLCTILLLFNPMHIFFLDFQLSFGLTFALVWLASLDQKAPQKT